MKQDQIYVRHLIECLKAYNIQASRHGKMLQLTYANHQKTVLLDDATDDIIKPTEATIIPMDYVVRQPGIVAGILSSHLQANKKIFARKCTIQNIPKTKAYDFLNRYHLLGATGSDYHVGLVYEKTLVAVAAFSKGRKMNRLPNNQRSFELIRFCTKAGLTVTGGLSKLLEGFCETKMVGDIMTYVDKQLSDGRSFARAGFTYHSEKEAQVFQVNKKTFERTMFDKASYHATEYYLTRNAGSIKMIYHPKQKNA